MTVIWEQQIQMTLDGMSCHVPVENNFSSKNGVAISSASTKPSVECVRKVGNSEALAYLLQVSNVLVFFTLGSVQDRGGSGSAAHFRSFTYLIVTGMSGHTETKGKNKRMKAAQGSFAFLT